MSTEERNTAGNTLNASGVSGLGALVVNTSIGATKAAIEAVKNPAGAAKAVATGVALGKATGVIGGGSAAATGTAGAATGAGAAAGTGATTTTGAAASGTGAGIGTSLMAAAPYAGAAAGALLIAKGTKDLLTGAETKGLDDWAARGQLAVTTGGLSEVYRGVQKVFGGGKHKDQEARDAMRGFLKKKGIIDEEYNLDINGTKFNIGRDGGDPAYNVDFEQEGVGDIVGMINPLFAYITKGDKKLTSDFTGYVTNAVMAAGGDKQSAIRDLYLKMGFKDVNDVLSSIDDSVKAGKISKEDHAAYRNGVLTAFSAAPVRSDEIQEKQYRSTQGMLKAMQVSNAPAPDMVEVGADGDGNPVYSSIKLANSSEMNTGLALASMTGSVINAAGVFTPEELGRYSTIGTRASDKKLQSILDNLHRAKDVEGFMKEIGSPARSGYAAFELFNKWGTLSPAQKSLGVAGAMTQDFVFDDGKSVFEKEAVPRIPGEPGMLVSDLVKLSGQGINVPPLARKWGEYTAVVGAVQTPTKASEVADIAQSLGSLGYEADARAIPINAAKMKEMGMIPAPQFGVGAALYTNDAGVPQGYTRAGTFRGRQVIIPEDNADTGDMLTPEAATDNARVIYRNWTRVDKPTQGTEGGSALVSGVNKLLVFNPAAHGAAVGYATFQNVADRQDISNVDDLAYFVNMAGISLERLKAGEVNPEIDRKGAQYQVGSFMSESVLAEAMRIMRSVFSSEGISSKEIGYQLASQGYAENRFDELQTVALQRSLDLVFDQNSYSMANRLRLGKQKGLETAVIRNG